VLAHLIPWDELCSVYYKQVGRHTVGRAPLKPPHHTWFPDYQVYLQPG